MLLKKFSPEPIFVLSTQGVALAVLRASGVLGNGVKRQLDDGAQALAGVFVDIAHRVFALEGFNMLRKRLNLRQKQGVGKQAPTMHQHR